MKYLFLIVLAFIAFMFGMNWFRYRERMKQIAVGVAVEQGVNHVKSEWEITKSWANNIWKYWQSVWK